MKIGLKVKLVNHNFIQAMTEAGFKNAAELSRASGFHQTVIGKWINLKCCPNASKVIDKLEHILKVPIDFLFPPDLVEAIVKKPETRFYFHKELETLSFDDVDPKLLSYNPSNVEILGKEALKNSLSSIFDSLTEREEKVLRLRFGIDDGYERSLREVGKIFNVNAERVRQIQAKAMQKIKSPHRAKLLEKLKQFL